MEKSIPEIIKEIQKYKCKKICITGGEPLLQKDTMDLIAKLLEKDFKISIETNGSMDIRPLTKKEDILISMDIKCPSSEMHEKMLLRSIKYLTEKDQVKFIIADKKDYDYAKEIIKKFKPKCDIFFQPVWKTDPKNLAEWILKDRLNIKLGVQLHKIIWGDRKGV
jgi:7-carboxy-7-deazaguanine synthase